MTTVKEVNRIKFIFRRVLLFCFTAELDELIHNACTCELIIKTIRLHT